MTLLTYLPSSGTFGIGALSLPYGLRAMQVPNTQCGALRRRSGYNPFSADCTVVCLARHGRLEVYPCKPIEYLMAVHSG